MTAEEIRKIELLGEKTTEAMFYAVIAREITAQLAELNEKLASVIREESGKLQAAHTLPAIRTTGGA